MKLFCIPRDGFIMSLRYWLIAILVGDMPVVINVVIARPEGFNGPLFRTDVKAPGMFIKNVLLCSPREDLLSAKRDTWTEGEPR